MLTFGTALAATLGVLVALGISVTALAWLVAHTRLGFKALTDPAERKQFITASINACILSKRNGNALRARIAGADYDPEKDPVPMSYDDLAHHMNVYFAAYRVNVHVSPAQAEMLLWEYMAPRSPLLETLDPRTR